MTLTRRILGPDGIVPLAMESVSGDVKAVEFLIGDFDPYRIGIGILHSGDRQAFLGRGVRDQFNDGFQRCQRFGTPVDGYKGKESVFDLVPLAASWRVMADGDGQPGFVS